MEKKEKKLKEMSLTEKIAHLRGYNIWTNDYLDTWSEVDKAFYWKRLNQTAHEVAIFVIIVAIAVVWTLCCLFF